MPKVIALTAFIILLALIFYLFFYSPAPKTTKIKIKDRDFTLEIAQTPAQRSRGLMYRKSLCPDCGMLFIFGKPGTYPFWMKNTLLPLDIIWLDQNGVVVDIQPGEPQNTSLLTNSSPAKYVLETNPNVTGLKIGDQIKL